MAWRNDPLYGPCRAESGRAEPSLVAEHQKQSSLRRQSSVAARHWSTKGQFYFCLLVLKIHAFQFSNSSRRTAIEILCSCFFCVWNWTRHFVLKNCVALDKNKSLKNSSRFVNQQVVNTRLLKKKEEEKTPPHLVLSLHSFSICYLGTYQVSSSVYEKRFLFEHKATEE